MSREEIISDENKFVLLSNAFRTEGIIDYLKSIGTDSRLMSLLNAVDRLATEHQYFDERCIDRNGQGGFVDVGCFDERNTLFF